MLLTVPATVAQAATGSPMNTGGHTCWALGKVKMRFVVASSSTPVTGYYITGGGSNDPTAIYPSNRYNNVFVPVNVPAGGTIIINTTFKKWFGDTILGPSNVKFTSGSPSIPAPTVFYGSPFFSCG